MYLATTITKHFLQLFFIIFILCLSLLITKTSAAAGRCYQCNSRNPSCGMDVNTKLKIDSTPCNGQCYTRLNRNDGNTIYRGCSWEHGFMKPEPQNAPIIKSNSVWMFCDTPYCNYEATALLNDVCYQPICNFFNFPNDCSLPNAEIICGRFCGNQLCGSRPIRRRTQQHNRIRSQKHRNHKPKHHRKNSI